MVDVEDEFGHHLLRVVKDLRHNCKAFLTQRDDVVEHFLAGEGPLSEEKKTVAKEYG